MPAKKTEVERVNPFGNLENVSPKILDNLDKMSPRIVAMIQDVASTMLPDIEDTFEVSMSIIDRILSAEKVEDVFTSVGALVHAKEELVNVPLEVTSIRWNVSTFEGDTSLGFYAVFEYVDLRTMKKDTASVGSLNCMAQLYALSKLDKGLPAELKLSHSAKPTTSGFYPLYFIPLNDEDREKIQSGEIIDAEESF